MVKNNLRAEVDGEIEYAIDGANHEAELEGIITSRKTEKNGIPVEESNMNCDN